MDTPTTTPIAGKDYPTTWVQFLDWFHSEQACRDYLEKLRWADGLICPKCGVISHVERLSRARLICPACRHQATATAGTIFDKTRTELRVWFAAIWYITSQKHGVSALGLQRVLGLGSYETAWTMLHRLRRAMVRPDRELLHGEVEVDETYLALTDRITLDHAGYCSIVCFSKRLSQNQSPTRGSWKSGQPPVRDFCGAKGIPRTNSQC